MCGGWSILNCGGAQEQNQQGDTGRMPPKVRELIRDLERAGFYNRGGKGSHRNFYHPKVIGPVTISGQVGHDAHHYQIERVRNAIEESIK